VTSDEREALQRKWNLVADAFDAPRTEIGTGRLIGDYTPRERVRAWTGWPIAKAIVRVALVLVATVLGFLLLIYGTVQSAQRRAIALHKSGVDELEWTAPANAPRRIQTADGATLDLAPGSTVSYHQIASWYPTLGRVGYIQGTVVIHRPLRPGAGVFYVLLNGGHNAKIGLGTSRVRATSDSMIVDLASARSGSNRLSGDRGPRVFFAAGDEARVGRGGAPVVIKGGNAYHETAR